MGRATGKNNKDLGALQLLQGLLGTLGSAGRGLVAGTAGLPGDIEALVRVLPGFDEKTVLPTSEEVSGALPKLPTQYWQPVAESLGQMGAMTPGQVTKLGKASKAGALALMDRVLIPSRVAQAGAIKPRGGNWITEGPGSPKEEIGVFAASVADPGNEARFRALFRDTPEEEIQRKLMQQRAVNAWLRGPATKYVKNELGADTDPIRSLMDQGIKHASPQDILDQDLPLDVLSGLARYSRNNATHLRGYTSDFTPRAMAQTDEGRVWENIGDAAVRTMTKQSVPLEMRLANPWLDRLGDNDIVHSLQGVPEDSTLGFEQLSKMFMDAMNTGKLHPEQLQQMSMEKAVRFADKQRRAKLAADEARLVKQAAEAAGHGEVIKEYPEGFRWVDLKSPEKLEDMSKVRQNSDGTWSPVDSEGNVLKRIEVMGRDPVDVIERTPEDAYLGGMLGHEGRVMDQCVGGYCQDVVSGKTRVLSLRGPDNKSHVTIELDQNDNGPTAAIMQVKGAKNSRPKDEYQQYITDLVRSNKFDIAGDIKNTNLIGVEALNNERQFAFGPEGIEFKPWKPEFEHNYYEPHEISKILKVQKPEGVNENFWNGFIKTYVPKNNYAQGGAVRRNWEPLEGGGVMGYLLR